MSDIPSHKELKERWERNSTPPKRRSFPAIVRIRAGVAEHQPAERPKNLRGPDLVRELARLGAVWWDERFLDCIQALFDHGIVDEQDFRFTKKKEPTEQQLADRKRQSDADHVAQVLRLRKKRKWMSWRRACDEVAADTGRGGASFTAASESLRVLVRRSSNQPARRPARRT
jgi:hypothetical protein